jgi:hypothetical protein
MLSAPKVPVLFQGESLLAKIRLAKRGSRRNDETKHRKK